MADIIEILKTKQEIIPDRHDGSYELMRATISAYVDMSDLSLLNIRDLNLVYLTCVGTWKQRLELKKKLVQDSSLPEDSKAALIVLWDEVWQRAVDGQYSNCENTGTPSIGMFGTGFFSFDGKSTDECAKDFINMCVDILPLQDDDAIFDRAAETLTSSFKGMDSAAASMVLHCLKPYTFPIMNSNMGHESIFSAVGVKLVRPEALDTYIDNCRLIKVFRDQNFTFKNYRVFDMAAWELNAPEEGSAESTLGEKHAWLLNWNSSADTWNNYADVCKIIKAGHPQTVTWKCDSMDPDPGDEVFLMKTGQGAKGIIGHGTVVGVNYGRPYWNNGELDFDRMEKFINVSFDRLINYETESYLNQNELKRSIPSQQWSPQNSGIEIRKDVRSKLQEMWNGVLYQGGDTVRYWLYAPGEGAEIWDQCLHDRTMAIGWGWVGPVDGFTSSDGIKKYMNEHGEPDAPYKWPSLALWQFVHVMKPGDMVFVKSGRSELLGRGFVEGDYKFDDSKEDYRHVRHVIWTKTGHWKYSGNFITKTLTDISRLPDMIAELNGLIDGENETDIGETDQPQTVEIDPDELNPSEAEVIRWYRPVVEALLALGGEANKDQAIEKVLSMNKVSDEMLSRTIKSGGSALKRTIEFARNDLRAEGFINNNERGIWQLTDIGKKIYISDKLASKIRPKWIKINSIIKKNRDNHENRPIPIIDLTPYYMYRYDENDFLRDVYISHTEYNTLKGVLLRKKNVLLEGAPGVGKTFAAKRVAYSMMGCKDEERIKVIQFHQSYSYEDFIMGFRPTETGFELHEGVFYRFCKKAEEDPDRGYFFIIDEINRGNLSKIFGELFMLVESDNREEIVQLLYRDEDFSVPKNLYIIGMMNTADRSLAMIDYALRRRFGFYPMEPAFDHDGFRSYQGSLCSEKFDRLINTVKELNKAIYDDGSLGPGFRIGHSYFCNLDQVTDEVLSGIVEYEIIPLLREYWFDEQDKVRDWSDRLLKSIR